MRRNILPALILFLFTFSTAQAQLQKGDFFTQPSATLEYNFDGPHQVERFNQNLFLNGYWMVSKRIMVGGGLLLDNGNIDNKVSITEDGGFFGAPRITVGSVTPYFNYQLETEIRTYFHTGKFAPYIYAKGSYDRTKFKAPYYYDLESEDIIRHSNSASDNETRITADLGLGFDFFITPNLVLGTRLGWDIYKKGDFNSQTADKEFHLNSGFSLLFKKADQSSQQPLIDRYMKAGNMLIQGNLSYKRPRSNDDKFHQVSMLTETSYFISNRTEAIMKLGFDFVRIETWFDVNTNDRIVYSISDLNTGLGIRHHFKLNNNLFLAATGRVEIFSQRQLPQETNNRQTTIPISLDLVYFKNQSRFFLGNTYWRSNRSLFYDRRVKRKTQGYNTYLGFDYFFRPSIYLRSQLTTLIYTDAVRTYYDLPKLKDNLRRVNLSFTFGFLINS